MKLITTLACLLASASIAGAQIVAVEHFRVSNTSGLGYKANLNMASGAAQGNAQNPPPAETGLQKWLVQNVWLNSEVTAGNLSFSNLANAGGRFQGNAGGTGAWAVYNTTATGLFSEYVASGNDAIGSVDNKTVYLSFLYRLTALPTGQRQNYIALGYATADYAPGADPVTGNFTSRFQMGQGWLSDNLNAGGLTLAPVDTDTHLFVIKFEYKAGVDTATIWLDPDISKNEAGNTPVGTRTGDYKFNAIEFKSMGLQRTTAPYDYLNIDEIRWAKTWEDALPLAATYTLTVPITGNGTVTLDPAGGSYLEGTEVTLTAAAGSTDHRFQTWSGTDVPVGKETTNPLKLVMDANKTITAEFQLIPSYDITVEIEPAAGGQVAVSENNPVKEGTVVSFEAVPEEGYEFANWAIGTSTFTANPLERTISANTTVTANFRSTALSVAPTSQSVNATGGSFEIAVTTETAWNATKTGSWIAITQGGTTTTGNGTVKYTVLPNTTEAVRSGSITVKSQTVAITQYGKSILTNPTVALGGGWKWNALGYFFDEYYPYVWWHDHSAWLWIYQGGTEAAGYYLYDFGQNKWGWTRSDFYATGVVYF